MPPSWYKISQLVFRFLLRAGRSASRFFGTPKTHNIIGKSKEMPVKYSQEFQVPKEYPDVLRNLTREILRQQPKDINKFGELPVSMLIS
jgi:hypothetical protein